VGRIFIFKGMIIGFIGTFVGNACGYFACWLLKRYEFIELPKDVFYVNTLPVKMYPDYYPDRPGATVGGRVLEPVSFDGTSLGANFKRLRRPLPEFTLFGGMMVNQKLKIVNSDPTLHNIHCWAEKNPQFNIGQPVKDMTTEKTTLTLA
jgi:hypothetical protein